MDTSACWTRSEKWAQGPDTDKYWERDLSSFVTDLLHPTTEVVQGIWVDVPVGDELGEVKVLKENWLEVDAQCASIQTSSVGTGCFSLLTKKTPLFLSGLGQSVWMIRWPAVFWEITWRMWMVR